MKTDKFSTEDLSKIAEIMRMFDINKISRNTVTGQFTCSYNAGSSTKAKDIQTLYLMSVNERFNFTAEIRVKGSIVTIASNSPDITKYDFSIWIYTHIL